MSDIPLHDDGIPHINIETGGMGELEKTVAASGKVIGALVNFAVENGANPVNLDHVSRVTDIAHWRILPPEAFQPHQLAKTDPNTGDVSVRKDRISSLHTVTHEGVHRAAVLKRLQEGKPHPGFVVAGLFGFELSDHGRGLRPLDETNYLDMNNQARQKSLKKSMSDIRTATELLNEGITEWSVRRANGLQAENGKVIEMSQEDAHPDGVSLIQDLKKESSIDSAKIDALLIEAALTGDVNHLANSLGSNLLLKILRRGVSTQNFMKAMLG